MTSHSTVEGSTWSTRLEFPPTDEQTTRILDAEVTVSPTSPMELVVHDRQGIPALLGPRETTRVLDAAADAAAIQSITIAASDEERQIARSAYYALHRVANKHRDRSVRRPTWGLIKFLTRGLGSLPDFTLPEHDEFARPRGFRILAVLLLVGLLTAVATVWPMDLLTRISPLDAVAGAGTTSQVIAVLNVLIGGGVIVGLVFGGWSRIDKFVFKAALREEVWFRLGSESWSWRQRVRSCVGFSFAHVLHIILLAVTFGLLLLVGTVFMAVYLHQFRKTNDQRKALYVAARFHADYNMAVVGLVLFSLSLTFLSSVFALIPGA